MMNTQTFIKTLLACGLLMLSVEASQVQTTSKASARRPPLSQPQNMSMDKMLEDFRGDQLATLSRQMKQLQDIVQSYIAWELTTTESSPEYKRSIEPYVKIMACYQRSSSNYMQQVMEKYESQVRKYIEVTGNGLKALWKIIKNIVKGDVWGSIKAIAKSLQPLWNRIKIEFKFDVEDFEENKDEYQKPKKIFERLLRARTEILFTYKKGALALFLKTFHKNIKKANCFFESMKREEAKMIGNNEGQEIIQFSEQFAKNNEMVIRMVKHNFAFSRKQYGLQNNKVVFSMPFTYEDDALEKTVDTGLSEGDDIYDKANKVFGTVTEIIDDDKFMCKFGEDEDADARECNKSDANLTKAIRAVNIGECITRRETASDPDKGDIPVVGAIKVKGNDQKFCISLLQIIDYDQTPKTVLKSMIGAIKQSNAMFAHNLNMHGGVDVAFGELEGVIDTVDELKAENEKLKAKLEGMDIDEFKAENEKLKAELEGMDIDEFKAENEKLKAEFEALRKLVEERRTCPARPATKSSSLFQRLSAMGIVPERRAS